LKPAPPLLMLLPALVLVPLAVLLPPLVHGGGWELIGSFALAAVTPSLDPVVLASLLPSLLTSRRAPRSALSSSLRRLPPLRAVRAAWPSRWCRLAWRLRARHSLARLLRSPMPRRACSWLLPVRRLLATQSG
jgi:phosphonate transport system permease protein